VEVYWIAGKHRLLVNEQPSTLTGWAAGEFLKIGWTLLHLD
jgi:hypothetical protein